MNFEVQGKRLEFARLHRWKLKPHPVLRKGKKIMVIILDKWGEQISYEYNAIHVAAMPTMGPLRKFDCQYFPQTFNFLMESSPHTEDYRVPVICFCGSPNLRFYAALCKEVLGRGFLVQESDRKYFSALHPKMKIVLLIDDHTRAIHSQIHRRRILECHAYCSHMISFKQEHVSISTMSAKLDKWVSQLELELINLRLSLILSKSFEYLKQKIVHAVNLKLEVKAKG